ncbi:hypothetical protein AHIS1636_12760 [Arthrobacter mangrovi]|uniref:Uncharacterized protein n=1 Tax=Arthrobacter mangrovi TaxID=2966350 RepID=A0ABQ5MS82_9MICC|nr:hypothetical protein AHIS1636_12760 [Arthrobacter mangrovi]
MASVTSPNPARTQNTACQGATEAMTPPRSGGESLQDAKRHDRFDGWNQDDGHGAEQEPSENQKRAGPAGDRSAYPRSGARVGLDTSD